MASSRCYKVCNRVVVLSIIVILVNTWASFAEYLIVDENCDEKGHLFYEDLGCKPRRTAGRWCPTSFDCSNLTTSPNTCRLGGKKYNPGEPADRTVQEHACLKSCTCRQRPLNQTAEFLCGYVTDCPEWIDTIKLKPGCRRRYELHRCCSAGITCENDEIIPKLFNITCNYRNKTYFENEVIYLTDYCVKCLCHENFGSNIPPINQTFCSRIRCGIDLLYPEKIEQYCAPAYIATEHKKICCPNSFVCPTGNDDIVDSEEPSEFKCRFGEQFYNMGASFNQSLEVKGRVRDFNCSCKVPPFFTCLESI